MGWQRVFNLQKLLAERDFHKARAHAAKLVKRATSSSLTFEDGIHKTNPNHLLNDFYDCLSVLCAM